MIKETNKLKVQRVELCNLLHLKGTITIDTGGITLVSGSNEVGKTSVTDGVLEAFAPCGNRYEMINKDSKIASVGLKLNNDVTIKKQLNGTQSALSIKDGNGKNVRNGKDWLKDNFPIALTSPLEFINSSKAERIEAIIDCVKMDYPKEAIDNLIDDNNLDIVLSGIALTDLNRIHKNIFDYRTDVNRTIKEKKSSIEDLKQALSVGVKSAYVTNQSKNQFIASVEPKKDALKSKMDKLFYDDSIRKKEVNKAIENEQKALTIQLDKEKQELKRIHDQKILELTAEYNKQENIIDKKLLNNKNSIAEKHKESYEKEASIGREEYRKLSNKLTEITATFDMKIKEFNFKLEAAIKQDTVNETIQDNKKRLNVLESDSEKFTKDLTTISKLKTEFLENMPIKGLEVIGKDIYVNKILFDKLNTAQQIEIAVDIALQSKPKLMIVDGIEALDNASLAVLFKKVTDANVQLIATEVDRGEKINPNDIEAVELAKNNKTFKISNEDNGTSKPCALFDFE